MAAGKKRQANFELLRMTAMLMVVAMHFLSHTGGLPEAGQMPGARGTAAVLVESFCIVAVNVYVLISGYFLSESGFSLKRLLRLLFQVLFYTLLIPPVLVLAGVLPAGEAFQIYHIWQCLFPVEAGHYWFVTAYVVMYLFSPVLNAAAGAMTQKQLRITLMGLLVYFSLGKSVSILLFSSDRYGYDFGWFIFLYLTAAYIRRYGIRFFQKKKRGALVYFGSCAAVAGITLAALVVCARTGALEYYVTVPFHYNFIFCLTGALGLFMAFGGLRIRSEKLERCISRLSPGMFGVYLIHEHMDISARWTGWIIGTPSEHLGGYLMQMTESVLLVFLLAAAIDLVRGKCFLLAERLLAKTSFGKKCGEAIRRIDDSMGRQKG